MKVISYLPSHTITAGTSRFPQDITKYHYRTIASSSHWVDIKVALIFEYLRLPCRVFTPCRVCRDTVPKSAVSADYPGHGEQGDTDLHQNLLKSFPSADHGLYQPLENIPSSNRQQQLLLLQHAHCFVLKEYPMNRINPAESGTLFYGHE